MFRIKNRHTNEEFTAYEVFLNSRNDLIVVYWDCGWKTRFASDFIPVREDKNA